MQNVDTILKINENNKLNMLVIDNFYENPLAVREFALSQKIDIIGKFPGKRTLSFSSDELKNELQKLIEPYGEIDKMYVPMNNNYDNENENENNSGSFFINTSSTTMPWIHNDEFNYSAIIYLTPDAPIESGTTILKPNDNSLELQHSVFDNTKWKLINKIGNKFNRIIIFDCLQYHIPSNYFGINNIDGRLTQVVWFNIIPKNQYILNSMVPNHSFVYCKLNKIDEIQKKNELLYRERIDNKIIKSVYPCRIHPNYNCDFIIIDNFYNDPLAVVEFALSQKFYITGNFLGKRTPPFLTNEIIKHIDNYLHQFGIDMSNIRKENTYCGSFQYITSEYKKVIHNEVNNDWIGIIFLTPNAPIESGLSFYEYIDKTTDINTMNIYSQDMTKWKQVDTIGNIFNRCVLFNSKNWYSFKHHFGTNINNCNLFQIFSI